MGYIGRISKRPAFFAEHLSQGCIIRERTPGGRIAEGRTACNVHVTNFRPPMS